MKGGVLAGDNIPPQMKGELGVVSRGCNGSLLTVH